MARQFVNVAAEQVVKDTLSALGGTATFADLKARMEADGNGALVRDVLGLHLGGRIHGLVRAQPDSKPVLFLSLSPFTTPIVGSEDTTPAAPPVIRNPPAPTNPVG